MKFGLFYLPTYLPGTHDAHTQLKNVVEQVQFADRIGIVYAWFVEHHFVRHGGICGANFSLLAYLAARCVYRIRLAARAASCSEAADGRAARPPSANPFGLRRAPQPAAPAGK